jgi:hypothetical protein
MTTMTSMSATHPTSPHPSASSSSTPVSPTTNTPSETATTLVGAPAPHETLKGVLALAGSKPLRERIPAAAGLRITTDVTAQRTARDAATKARGAGGPQRANLPRRRATTRKAIVPGTPAPEAAPPVVEEAAKQEEPALVASPAQMEEPVAEQQARCTLQPAKANLPRRRGRKTVFVDPGTPAVTTPPTTTKNAIVGDGRPTFAEDVGSCLQRLAPGLSVAFAGERSEDKVAGYFPSTTNTNDAASRFTHVLSVVPVANPTKEIYHPTTPPSEGTASRLTLAVPFLGVHPGLPRAPLSRAQLVAGASFLRAARAEPEADVLVSVAGLRPADAVVLVLLAVVVAPGAAAAEEAVREWLWTTEEDEGVLGWWKAVVLDEDVARIVEAMKEMS